MYRITHYYYSIIGAMLVLIVGIPVSLITGRGQKQKVDKSLLSPVVSWMVSEETEELSYYDVNKAVKMLTIHKES